MDMKEFVKTVMSIVTTTKWHMMRKSPISVFPNQL